MKSGSLPCPPTCNPSFRADVHPSAEKRPRRDDDRRRIEPTSFEGLDASHAGCVIVDVASNEELFELLTRLPIAGYIDWEIVPLIKADTALETAKWALQQLSLAGTR